MNCGIWNFWRILFIFFRKTITLGGAYLDSTTQFNFCNPQEKGLDVLSEFEEEDQRQGTKYHRRCENDL